MQTDSTAGAVTHAQKREPVGQDAKPLKPDDPSGAQQTPAPDASAVQNGSAARQSTPPQGLQVPAMPEAARAQMLHQITTGVETMALRTGGAGQQQVTLQLHPRDWGQLNVSVTMTPTTGADGKVSTQVVAHVVAENPSVKAALESQQTDLRQSLRDAGLHLDRLSVTVQPASAGAQTSAGGGQHTGHSDAGSGSASNQGMGTSAQAGTSGGGNNSSPYAAFAQNGQHGRQTPASPTVPTGQPAGLETDDVPASISQALSRFDTRA